MSGNVFNPTIQMRTYLSSHHLWAAKHFADLAGEIEDEYQGRPSFNLKHRAYVMASILSTVAFLEATINEVFQDACEQRPSYVGSLNSKTLALMKDFWEITKETKNKSRTTILHKYQYAICFADIAKFIEKESPYQDVALLVDLRNELVHYKPKFLGGDSTHRLQSILAGKFPENRLMAGTGNPFFPDKCLGKGCADWAVNSSRKFADEFFKRIKIKPNYQRLKI